MTTLSQRLSAAPPKSGKSAQVQHKIIVGMGRWTGCGSTPHGWSNSGLSCGTSTGIPSSAECASVRKTGSGAAFATTQRELKRVSRLSRNGPQESAERFVLRAGSHVCQKQANMGHPQVEVLFFVLKVKSGNVGHRPNEQREQLCPAVEVPHSSRRMA